MFLPIYLGRAAPHHFEPQDCGDVVTQLLLFIIPSFLTFLTFLLAGIGLLMRRVWGFFFHIAGSALTILSLIFIPYSVISLVFSLKPAFRELFFPLSRH